VTDLAAIFASYNYSAPSPGIIIIVGGLSIAAFWGVIVLTKAPWARILLGGLIGAFAFFLGIGMGVGDMGGIVAIFLVPVGFVAGAIMGAMSLAYRSQEPRKPPQDPAPVDPPEPPHSAHSPESQESTEPERERPESRESKAPNLVVVGTIIGLTIAASITWTLLDDRATRNKWEAKENQNRHREFQKLASSWTSNAFDDPEEFFPLEVALFQRKEADRHPRIPRKSSRLARMANLSETEKGFRAVYQQGSDQVEISALKLNEQQGNRFRGDAAASGTAENISDYVWADGWLFLFDYSNPLLRYQVINTFFGGPSFQDRGFSKWMPVKDLKGHLRKNPGRDRWITAIEGRWENDTEEYRVRVSNEDGYPWGWCRSQDHQTFLAKMRRTGEVSNWDAGGFHLSYHQVFLMPDGSERHQGVWRNIIR
jgi:hypothetical protein